jgi:hypothetical protein
MTEHISTTDFFQLYIIIRHICGHLQKPRLFNKQYSNHRHTCCPTSDAYLPGMRISPIREAEREYYCWELPYFLSFCSQLKSKVGNPPRGVLFPAQISSRQHHRKATALRINQNINGAPVASRSHTDPEDLLGSLRPIRVHHTKFS